MAWLSSIRAAAINIWLMALKAVSENIQLAKRLAMAEAGDRLSAMQLMKALMYQLLSHQ